MNSASAGELQAHIRRQGLALEGVAHIGISEELENNVLTQYNIA